MSDTSTSQLPVAVIGEGWAATALVTMLSTGETPKKVIWVAGTGSRAFSPLPTLEAGVATEFVQTLLARLGIEEEPAQAGCFVREFKNKSFARPAWTKAPTREDRVQVMQEVLWAPETRFTPAYEAQFSTPIYEIEETLRTKAHELPNVKLVSGVPVSGFEAGVPAKVIMGSGETFEVEHVYFADRWTSLNGLEGLPKGNALTRKREPMGILQAIFTHQTALVSSDLREGFIGQTHKDPGEEITRDVMGYFFDGGKRSVWSIFLAPEEAEDNHAIAKKLRRLKQALDRMFTGSDWLPEGTATFLDTVKNEQIRFEEAFVLSEGEIPTQDVKLGKVDFMTFVTDGFGPSVAYEMVARALGEIRIPETKTETEVAPSA